MSQTYDLIVLGAGGMGSAAAYYAARDGQKTLLLEQFALDHSLGSSGDHSRIIRYAYDHPAYIELVHSAYALWRDLEAASGDDLMRITGGLDFGYPDETRFAATKQAMETLNIPFDTLSPAEVSARFPQFRLAEGMIGLFQADAGLLRASACVRAHVRLAQRHGADFLPDTPISAIHPGSDGVMVETAKGRFSAARLVIAAGSWAGPLLASLGLKLPLQPTREQVVYFEGGPEYEAGAVPVFIAWEQGDPVFYGIGSIGGSGFKCAQHGVHEPTHPDNMKRETDPEYIEKVRGFLRRSIPALADARVVASKTCLYTMTPDEHFIIDRHPDYPFISFGAGFSGHGFKFSTLIGKILVEIASGKTPENRLDLFNVGRFL